MSQANTPYFSCQNDDCAAEVSFPAEMLAVFEGSPICENCYGDIDGPEEGELPEYSDLPDFVPEYEIRIKELCEQVQQLEAKNAELKVKTFAWFNNEDCWMFQDDGDDYPASLVCPVVMSAEKLRELMAARSERDELKGQVDRLIAFSAAAGIAYRDNDGNIISEGFRALPNNLQSAINAREERMDEEAQEST